jgi:multidrug efflux pump subunit AcrA (membrane-fusion protein)
VVVQIQDQSVLELRFTLPESALGTVREGTAVRAKFSSEPAPRELVVDRVDPVVDARARTLTAVVLIDNPEGRLRPGMLAEISVGDGAAAPAPTEPADSVEPVEPAAPAAPAGAGK